MNAIGAGSSDYQTSASSEFEMAGDGGFESCWVAQSASDWMVMADSTIHVNCLVDGHGRVVHANRGLERWGLVADKVDFRGTPLHELLHPSCTTPNCGFGDIAADIATVRRDGRPLVREISDGVLERHVRMTVIPVLLMPQAASGGSSAHAAIVRLQDFSVQKRTERWLRDSVDELNLELKKRTAALEQASELHLRANASLLRAESELRLLSAALMTMQEMERKRIATELHDSIGQSLSALGFGVGVALDAARGGDTRLACDMLEKLAPQVKETIAEVRRIAMDLCPATLDDLGIVGTLSWFFREFRAIHPGLSLLTEVDLDERDVATALRTTVFRVVQEALNNVVKHARATEIHIRLWRGESDIHLEVADNGRGFNAVEMSRPGMSSPSMGLKGMRDRVEFSAGRFRLESEPGQGTKVSASWPLRRE
jgi:signal transduction histidine kinase